MRLPLSVTVHHNTFLEDGLDDAIEAYDRRREAAQPYAAQRYVREFGLAETYGWSEDKARQYAHPERADFGDYVRRNRLPVWTDSVRTIPRRQRANH